MELIFSILGWSFVTMGGDGDELGKVQISVHATLSGKRRGGPGSSGQGF